jgi:urease accessory protein
MTLPTLPARLRALPPAAALLLTLAALPARAHGGHELSSGFLAAVAHPWTGADHLFATLAAGLLAAHLGGRAGAAVLGAFLAGLLAGAAAGAAGWGGSPAEVLLGASVAGLGLLSCVPAARGRALGGLAAFAFAAVHGHAHQLEGGVGPLWAPMAGLWLSSAALLLLGGLVGRGALRAGLMRAALALPLGALGGMLSLRALLA